MEDAGEVLKSPRRKKSHGEGPVGPESPGTHVEAAVDGLSKPDMLLLALAAPPVLLGHSRRVGVDASLACLHVAENFHGVQGAALVGVNPVVSCRRGSSLSGSDSNPRARLAVSGREPSGNLGQRRLTCVSQRGTDRRTRG